VEAFETVDEAGLALEALGRGRPALAWACPGVSPLIRWTALLI
jgi:hypothetical protein